MCCRGNMGWFYGLSRPMYCLRATAEEGSGMYSTEMGDDDSIFSLGDDYLRAVYGENLLFWCVRGKRGQPCRTAWLNDIIQATGKVVDDVARCVRAFVDDLAGLFLVYIERTPRSSRRWALIEKLRLSWSWSTGLNCIVSAANVMQILWAIVHLNVSFILLC